MGSIVGTVTDSLGLTDNKGAKAAKNAAANASAYSAKLAKENIKFQKGIYANWQAVYGDLQKNLGEYYKNLTPEKVTTLGLQNQQKEYQVAVKAIEENMAQRGLSKSGQETAALTQMAMSNATARASIRTSAEEQVAKQKMNFLALGVNQAPQLASNVSTAYGTGVQSSNNTAQTYASLYQQMQSQNLQATQDFMGTIFGAASAGMGSAASAGPTISSVSVPSAGTYGA